MGRVYLERNSESSKESYLPMPTLCSTNCKRSLWHVFPMRLSPTGTRIPTQNIGSFTLL